MFSAPSTVRSRVLRDGSLGWLRWPGQPLSPNGDNARNQFVCVLDPAAQGTICVTFFPASVVSSTPRHLPR